MKQERIKVDFHQWFRRHDPSILDVTHVCDKFESKQEAVASTDEYRD